MNGRKYPFVALRKTETCSGVQLTRLIIVSPEYSVRITDLGFSNANFTSREAFHSEYSNLMTVPTKDRKYTIVIATASASTITVTRRIFGRLVLYGEPVVIVFCTFMSEPNFTPSR